MEMAAKAAPDGHTIVFALTAQLAVNPALYKKLPYDPVKDFEPITLLSALSAVTSRIGLVSTISTTYTPPYNIARQMASLDCISGRRAGWNLVTSADDFEAQNFGLDEQLAHAERYARA